MITTRGRLALAAGSAARWASRATGRGAGAMIGGLVAMTLDRSILRQLGRDRRTVVVTGTNGKSTTTRMTAAALATLGPVASNSEGANMDAGLVAALAAARDARRPGCRPASPTPRNGHRWSRPAAPAAVRRRTAIRSTSSAC